MSKYGNRKTAVNGITFDSAKEAGRYQELMLLLRAGEIEDLRLQPEYTIQEAFKTPDGTSVRALRYRADFSYRLLVREGPDTRRETVVEDIKGFRTKEYEIKKKLLAGMGILVHEV
ncbi:conserved hypothetical protein [uncultured Eubacteriales bacterium]|uniref:DUF1064 domain-containing protein n=1 Tax=uncultured Eubacteriales bacterium TaxID=172733 RepID=A0A212J176_9FIRM|nr:conserved hypothetical protein [uncultured Eubacteriales bacterium]